MKSSRIIFLLALIGAGYYVYRSNLLVKLDARMDLTTKHVMVQALGGTYHNCKIILTGEYESFPPTLRQNEKIFIPIIQFQQWNGTLLESTNQLLEEVEINLQCDEGRAKEKVDNPAPMTPSEK